MHPFSLVLLISRMCLSLISTDDLPTWSDSTESMSLKRSQITPNGIR